MTFAVSSHGYDSTPPLPIAVHCYPSTFQGSGPSHMRGDTCEASVRHSGANLTNFKAVDAFPEGVEVNALNDCCALCNKEPTCTSWIASEDLKPDDKGKNCWPGFCVDSVGVPTLNCTTKAASNRVSAILSPSVPSFSDWWILGDKVDWYLAPSKTKFSQYKSYYELSGAPALPPRYGLGFMATYWGYQTMEQVIGNMTLFRENKLPIDSFIMDYDWWSCEDNKFGPHTCGINSTQDFEYDSNMWGRTQIFYQGGGWPKVETSNATDILRYMHGGIGSDDDPHTLRMRFSGSRKLTLTPNAQCPMPNPLILRYPQASLLFSYKRKQEKWMAPVRCRYSWRWTQ